MRNTLKKLGVFFLYVVQHAFCIQKPGIYTNISFFFLILIKNIQIYFMMIFLLIKKKPIPL